MCKYYKKKLIEILHMEKFDLYVYKKIYINKKIEHFWRIYKFVLVSAIGTLYIYIYITKFIIPQNQEVNM